MVYPPWMRVYLPEFHLMGGYWAACTIKNQKPRTGCPLVDGANEALFASKWLSVVAVSRCILVRESARRASHVEVRYTGYPWKMLNIVILFVKKKDDTIRCG